MNRRHVKPAALRVLGCVLTVLLVASGCDSPATAPERLSVYAASSLTDVFRDLADAFEAKHPHVELALTFEGSQIARLQLEHGAPGDVFASADVAHVQALVAAELATPPQVFASNELMVVVPRTNPAKLETFADLPRAGRLVVGNPNAPIGVYTATLLERARTKFGEAFTSSIQSAVVSRESNVRLVRAKVELGEADAAIVYRTDAMSSEHLATVAIPKELNPRSGYVISTITTSHQPELAEAFVRFVLSDEGQDIAARHGFLRGPS